MSLLQILTWLAQTATFTGVAFNLMVLLLSFFWSSDAVWLFLGTVPVTIVAAFVWLILHLLSSIIVKNSTSKLGWSLIGVWLTVHVVVFLASFDDPYDVLIPMMFFNTVYLVVSASLLFIFRKSGEEIVVKPEIPMLFRLNFQIALSILLAAILMSIFII